MSRFYGGSTILEPLSEIFGLPVDQINFVACSLLSILLGQLMRHTFSPSKFSGKVRGFIEAFFGFLIVIFCYGDQIKYLLVQSIVSYIMLILLPSRVAAHLVTYWSLGFLGVVHLYRIHFDYGGYTMDISGPVMIQTQKLTSLAFNLLDGYRLNRGLKLREKTHELHAVKEVPCLVNFYSYLMYFHGIQVGPFTFYNEYKEYINGYGDRAIPCATKQIQAALCLSVMHGLLTAYVAPQFPTVFVCSTDYQRMHMSRRIVFTMISFFLVRQKYYFAWSIAEAGSLSAGIGHNGYDWSRIKNYDFAAIESGACLKIITDGWNMSTARWLRELIYERSPMFCRTLLVFATSAFWHGFYPGYYLMFGTFAMFTFCARSVRKNVRPLFAASPVTLQLYHIITKVVTNLSLNYGQAPFYLLQFESGLLFWRPYYFFGHVIAMFVILILHVRPIINSKLVQMDSIIERKWNSRLSNIKKHLRIKIR